MKINEKVLKELPSNLEIREVLVKKVRNGAQILGVNYLVEDSGEIPLFDIKEFLRKNENDKRKKYVKIEDLICPDILKINAYLAPNKKNYNIKTLKLYSEFQLNKSRKAIALLKHLQNKHLPRIESLFLI